jgi:predicted metal-dependent hydrolase
MKKMLNIKKLGAIVAFGILVAPAFSQAPSQQGLPFDENSKQGWVQTHPAEYQKLAGQEMTAAEKEAWIQAHPAEYAKMHAPAPAPTRNESRVIVASDPTFPVYVNTGDAEKDAADYAARKEQWISKNGAKYSSMTATPTAPLSREERIQLYNSNK